MSYFPNANFIAFNNGGEGEGEGEGEESAPLDNNEDSLTNHFPVGQFLTTINQTIGSVCK